VPIEITSGQPYYIVLGIQGPEGIQGIPGTAEFTILPSTDPEDDPAILVRNGVGEIQDSGRYFNDSGETELDIWSAEKVLSYTIDGGFF
jgi:hypothetical protein